MDCLRDRVFYFDQERPNTFAMYLPTSLSYFTLIISSMYGDDFEVKLLEWECSHHCPFKGGGDLKIAKVGQSTSTAGTILISDPGALSSASQPDPSSLDRDPDRGSSLSPPPLVITDNITPPKKGEHRYGNFENKVATSCTENAVRV